ncbi:MAG: [Lachnospiraceae bacterium]|nr:[FeFe] hydrogenase H-cluster maturation GTPase HydF [Lachnospiraceae bacterium]
VITDSQALMQIKDIVPDEVPLTTFSILFARYKGFLEEAALGINAAKDLHDGAKILVCEGCTHHRQCNDIGTVKLPKAIKKLTGKDFNYEYTSGQGFPEDLSAYSMLVHCGACMVNDKEVAYRLGKAQEYNIPFTNYGITLAMASGTLERTLRIFPTLHDKIFG